MGVLSLLMGDLSSFTISSLFTFRNFLLITWNCSSALFVIWIVSTFLRKYLGLRIIGLTGGISTGKSTCCKYFIDSTPFYIIDFDEISHDIYACGRPAWSQIKKEFGDDVLNKDWTINRKKLGEIVWNDRKQLKKLMSITTWPILKDFLLELLINLFSSRTQILDVPLLIEQKYILYCLCDSVILIYCKKQEQIKRLMNRDRINTQQAMKKIDKQIDIEKKKIFIKSCRNYTIIDNTNDLYQTQQQLNSFMSKYRKYYDTVINGTCLWKQAIIPTKLSFIISTILCTFGYISHKIVTLI